MLAMIIIFILLPTSKNIFHSESIIESKEITKVVQKNRESCPLPLVSPTMEQRGVGGTTQRGHHVKPGKVTLIQHVYSSESF